MSVESTHSETETIKLYFDKGKAFVWNSKDWYILRTEHRICGGLIGSIASYPRQNDFLGLPMALTSEEARLLVEKGICTLNELPKLAGMPSNHQKHEFMEKEQQILSEQTKTLKNRKIAQMTEKLDIMVAGKKKKLQLKGITDVEIDKEAYLQAAINQLPDLSPAHVLVQIPTEDFLETENRSIHMDQLDPDFRGDNAIKYAVFKDLWHRGYYITSGSKFGCDYLVYKGDPVKFHATYMVRCVKLETLFNPTSIVTFGRLAVGVNKLAILAYLNAECNVDYQTLRWHDSIN